VKPLVGILYNVPWDDDYRYSRASGEVLQQVEEIQETLEELDYPVLDLPVTGDVTSLVEKVSGSKLRLAINLCESVDEEPRLAANVAGLMELMGVSLSGSPMMALALTTDKALTKSVLSSAGIPTAPWFIHQPGSKPRIPPHFPFPCILKPIWEDASVGIDAESVVMTRAELKRRLDGMEGRQGIDYGRGPVPFMVEQYIEGREFNLSVMALPVPQVLPLAEIVFEGFPEGMPRIMGYRAKWEDESFEYDHTERIVPSKIDPAIVRRMEKIVLDSFRLTGCRDFARVDLRVAEDGTPYVLEVNANPCLHPDAGFQVALGAAGITFPDFMEKMLDHMSRRSILDACPIPQTG